MAKARTSQKSKRPVEGSKNDIGKAMDEPRKQEQKTQDGEPEASKAPLAPSKEDADKPLQPQKKKNKELPFFSRERLKRTLGMKSPSEKAAACKAPAVKRPNWNEAVPESQLADDLTDFDVTKHTQDDNKDGTAETQSAYEDNPKLVPLP